MAAIDRSTQRVIAVIALMTVAALALRGYIPGISGDESIGEPQRPPSNPAALFVVIAMVCAAVLIIGIRDHRAAARSHPEARFGRSPAAGSRPPSVARTGASQWSCSPWSSDGCCWCCC